jgi:Zn-dependent peptidase ImmA (M78 family)
MTPQRRRSILNHAHDTLRKFNIEKPSVAVDRIAKNLGAQLRFSPLDEELSGMIYVKDGTPIIGVNALHHPHRQRFTIAHEIGHLILHKDKITQEVHVDKEFPMLMRNSVSAAGIDEIEIEANFFAAELLMPEIFLTKSLGDKSFDIDDDKSISELAKEFKVSLSSMRFRLGNLLT